MTLNIYNQYIDHDEMQFLNVYNSTYSYTPYSVNEAEHIQNSSYFMKEQEEEICNFAYLPNRIISDNPPVPSMPNSHKNGQSQYDPGAWNRSYSNKNRLIVPQHLYFNNNQRMITPVYQESNINLHNSNYNDDMIENSQRDKQIEVQNDTPTNISTMSLYSVPDDISELTSHLYSQDLYKGIQNQVIENRYFEIDVGPNEHQMKGWSITPTNILKINFEPSNSDVIAVSLRCDDSIGMSDPDIFLGASSPKFNVSKNNLLYLPFLKISKEMIQGPTKGFEFKLVYSLIVNGKVVYKEFSRPFRLHSSGGMTNTNKIAKPYHFVLKNEISEPQRKRRSKSKE